MKYIIILFFSIVFVTNLQAQNVQLSREDQVLMYECKTIEDFIFRFNNDSMSSLNQSISYYQMNKKLKRKESFELCFKMDEKRNFKNPVYQDFEKYIIDNNIQLQFEDSSWYVRVFCMFDFQGKDVKIPLLMQLTKISGNRRKWVIIDIGSNNILKNGNKDSIVSVSRQLKRSIDANSYAMNFLELREILIPTTKESSAFSKELLETQKGIQFLNLIKSNQLKFISGNSMTFYFAQVPGYFFIVDQFNDNSLNSGWLVNYIWKKSEEDKKYYLNTLVNAKK